MRLRSWSSSRGQTGPTPIGSPRPSLTAHPPPRDRRSGAPPRTRRGRRPASRSVGSRPSGTSARFRCWWTRACCATRWYGPPPAFRTPSSRPLPPSWRALREPGSWRSRSGPIRLDRDPRPVADELRDELPDLARRIAEADESRALGRIAPHDRVAGIRERPAVEVIRGAADHRHRPAGDNGDVRGELGRLRPAHHREPWWELGAGRSLRFSRAGRGSGEGRARGSRRRTPGPVPRRAAGGGKHQEQDDGAAPDPHHPAGPPQRVLAITMIGMWNDPSRAQSNQRRLLASTLKASSYVPGGLSACNPKVNRPTAPGATPLWSTLVATQLEGQSMARKALSRIGGFQVPSRTRPTPMLLRHVRPPAFRNSTQWVTVVYRMITSEPELDSRR